MDNTKIPQCLRPSNTLRQKLVHSKGKKKTPKHKLNNITYTVQCSKRPNSHSTNTQHSIEKPPRASAVDLDLKGKGHSFSSYQWPRRQMVWNRSERGYQCPMWTTIIEQRRWLTPAISHLKCSLEISSQAVQWTLTLFLRWPHMAGWGKVSQGVSPLTPGDGNDPRLFSQLGSYEDSQDYFQNPTRV